MCAAIHWTMGDLACPKLEKHTSFLFKGTYSLFEDLNVRLNYLNLSL